MQTDLALAALLTLSLGAGVLIDRYRARAQAARDAARVVYELRFPLKFDHEAALGAVLAMGGMLPPAGPELRGVPSIVVEAVGSARDGRRWRLAVPPHLEREVQHQLESHIPGAYLAEATPDAGRWDVAIELRKTRSGRGLEHNGWATIVSARNAIEARVVVTDRMTPIRVQGRVLHTVGLPYHWGGGGLATGDSANELTSLVMDPNSHIMETKALSCDIQPGRRPRGPARVEFVREYQRRAGITDQTGTEV